MLPGIRTVSSASVFTVLLLAGCVASTPPGSPIPPDPPPPPAAPDSAQSAQAAAWRAQKSAEVLEMIKGRENEPAEEVFKNIKVLRGVPAGRLIRIMDMGWGRALGVGCGHCHVVDKWELEDRPHKQVAREMAAMTRTINENLKAIPNLGGPNPAVN